MTNGGIMHRLCYKPTGKPVQSFEFAAVDYLDAIDHGQKCCEVLGAEFYSVEQVVERKGKPNEH